MITITNNGANTPFSLAIDRRQIDRAMSPGLSLLTVWPGRGKVLDLECSVRP